MKREHWITLFLVGAPVAAVAFWAAGACDRRVLNDQASGSSEFTGDPAAALQRLALEVKAASYDGSDGSTWAAQLEARRGLSQAAGALRSFDPASLASQAEKLAFWINLYNALTVHALIVFRPRWTVWEVPGFFDRAAYRLGGLRFSLNDIEHGVLRGNQPAPYFGTRPFGARDSRRRFALGDAELDSRVHFALNCGSRSCPPIAVYEAEQIDAQLHLAARAFVRGETEVEGRRIVTSASLKWYRSDLGDPREVLRRYLEPERAEQLGSKPIAFRKHDWRLTR